MNLVDTAYLRSIPLWAAVITLVPFSTACPGESPRVWIEAEEHLELSAEDVDLLAAVAHNGSIVVTAQDQNDRITIEVSKRAGGRTEAEAWECMDALRITTEKTGRTQKVGWTLTTAKGKSWGTRVSFKVTLPPRLAVSAETHNGPIEVTGVQGDCELETHNGAIEARTTGQKVSAETHNGRIDVTAAPVEVALVTHNGAIEARLDAPADLAGKIVTHNGAVGVHLGERTATNLACSTHNGHITCQRELSAVTKSRRRLVGRLGNSQAKLVVETHNGSIEVK